VDKSENISTTYTQDLPNPVYVPTLCFNANNTPGGLAGFTNTSQGQLGINTAARIGPIGSLPSAPVAAIRSQPNPVGRGDAACATLAARGDVTYTMPGFTYGPYNNGRYQSVSISNSPSKTNLEVASLTFDYDFGGKMSMKAITSYFFDGTKTVTSNTGPNQTGFQSAQAYNDPVFGLRVAGGGGPSWNPVFGPTAANVTGWFVTNNHRYGLTQEVRFQSAAEARPFSWVAGAYYSNIRADSKYDNYQPIDFWAEKLFGITGIQRYAVPGIETAPGLFNNFDKKRQRLKDVEVAAYAEGNYWLIPDKLRATVGIRLSRVSFDYEQSFTGAVSSVGPANTGVSKTGVPFNVPNSQNGGFNAGSTSESPITPKFSLQYNITDRDLVYVTAAKGFRAGGVNSQVSYGICQNALDQIGYLPADLPVEYKSDSVWSYEGGGKFRVLDNRVQFNAAVYRVDWKNPQYTTNPGSCGLVTTFNVPAARSQGVELEAQALVFHGFTVNGSYGYTDAKYTEGLILPAGHQAPGGPVPVPFTIVVAGQKIPVPPHTFSVGGRYDIDVSPRVRAYIRGDFRFQAAYPVSPFPTVTYTPDAVNQETQVANFRVGVEYSGFDVNLFVNNAFDRKGGTIGGGRGQCLPAAAGGTAACTTFNSYNPIYSIDTGYPREIGLQIAYRH
jgi:outer membrane receptor protein involved in Fe transport